MMRKLLALAIAGLVFVAFIGEAMAKSAGGPRGPTVKPAFTAAAKPAPLPKSAAPKTPVAAKPKPPTPAFNHQGGAKVSKSGAVHVTPKGVINPRSQAPGFNAAAGAKPKTTPPKVLTDKFGQKLPVPAGAKGPIPTRSNKGKGNLNGGVAFKDPKSGTTLRIMPPRGRVGKAPPYPNGYAVYQNGKGQTINHKTGKTITGKEPFKGHIPLGGW